MGAMAAAATVCVMIPLDTIKTRIVTQAANPNMVRPYKNLFDCAMRVMREEGIGTFYKPLAPRLVSVVPMIGIQFGVYEFMRRAIRKLPEPKATPLRRPGAAPTAPAPKTGEPEEDVLQELFDEIEGEV
jgi:solute carrier family 25 S-adenosylmethionine transporter 26